MLKRILAAFLIVLFVANAAQATVSSTTSSVQYTGNASTTAFSFAYPFFQASDLAVTLFDTSANAAVSPTPVLGGGGTYDYTVTPVSAYSYPNNNVVEYASATITFNNAPPANYRITLQRNVPATQGLNEIDNAKVPSSSRNAAFDRLTMLNQQAIAQLGLALQFPAADGTALTSTLPPAATRAGQLICFDASGNVALCGTAFPASISGNALNIPRVNAAGNAYEFRTPTQMRGDLGVTATGSDTTYAYRANNLSDLASASTARTNLALGTIATVNSPVPVANGGTASTSAGAAAANNIGALAEASNLSDLASAATARTNLGVTATGGDTTYAYRANNLSDLASASSARTNLGLGTAATASTGTSGGTIPLLNGANTWSAAQVFASGTVGSPTGGNEGAGTINATGLFVNGVAVATGVAQTIGSWTPTDASGASLTLTVVAAGYTQIGNMVHAYATVTYPSNANGSQAIIGGLPVTVPNQSYAVVPVPMYTNSGAFELGKTVKNSATFAIYNGVTSSSVANSALSTLTTTFEVVYPAS